MICCQHTDRFKNQNFRFRHNRDITKFPASTRIQTQILENIKICCIEKLPFYPQLFCQLSTLPWNPRILEIFFCSGSWIHGQLFRIAFYTDRLQKSPWSTKQSFFVDKVTNQGHFSHQLTSWMEELQSFTFWSLAYRRSEPFKINCLSNDKCLSYSNKIQIWK